MTISIRKSTIQAVLWLLFQSAGGRLVGVVTQLALAKLLLPSQFGIIGLVYTITTVANALVDFGIDGVLLQRHKALRLWIVPSFWTSLGFGLVGLTVVALVAPVLAHFYKAPEIMRLALLLSLSMPLGALSTIPSVKMRSDLNFRFPAIYGTFENLVSQMATVALAFFGFGALSFVLPTPVLALVKAAIYWWRAPVSLKGQLRRRQFAYLISNGFSVFGTRLIGEITSQADYAVLGLTASQSQVGLYFFAFKLSSQPLWILAGNFATVLFPALVQMKNDPARQLRAALSSAQMLAYVIMPICFLQAAVADPALRVFFGQKWSGSIHMAQLLSIGIPFDAVPWVIGALLTARREFRRGLISGFISLPCFIALVCLGSFAGKALGVAVMAAVYNLLFGLIYSLVNFRHCGATVADVLVLYIKPPLIAGTAMATAYIVSLMPMIAASQSLRLLEIAVLGPSLYFVLLVWFDPGAFRELLDKFGVAHLLGKLETARTRLIVKRAKPPPS